MFILAVVFFIYINNVKVMVKNWARRLSVNIQSVFYPNSKLLIFFTIVSVNEDLFSIYTTAATYLGQGMMSI